jgi:hypothetical protein
MECLDQIVNIALLNLLVALVIYFALYITLI